VGNSHGDDQFNMFLQRPDLFPDLSVLRHDVDLSCFESETDDFAGLRNLIQSAKDDGKKVVLTTNSLEFKMFTKTTIADRMIYMRSPQTKDEAIALVADVNASYYQNQIGLIHPLEETNATLAETAEAFDIQLLDKADYICEAAEQRCFGVTPSGQKVFWDYGHITNAGAAFLAERVAQMGWLDPLHQERVSSVGNSD